MNAELIDNDLSEILSHRRSPKRPFVRPIRNLDELKKIYKLTHDSYVQLGYSAPQASQMLIHYPYFDHIEETSILVAERDGELIGTISYSLDGLNGLTVDEDFEEVCNAERAGPSRLAAVWRLVVEERFRNEREIVTSLIREVIVQLRRNEIRNCLFAVNPKHAAIYQKMLNMQIIAEKQVTTGLSNAPAVLLRCDPCNLPARITPPDESYINPITIPVLLNIHAF